MKSKLIFQIFLILLILFSITGCGNKTLCLEKIGVIKDFDVNPGGFANRDMAKVVLDNNETFVINGYVVRDLEVNKCLYKNCKCKSKYSPHCHQIRDCDNSLEGVG